MAIIPMTPIIIDLGSATTVFYTSDDRILLQEPTRILFDTHINQYYLPASKSELGASAVPVVSPVRRGLPTDPKALEKLLQIWRGNLHLSWTAEIIRPGVLVVIPHSYSQMYAAGLKQILNSAGFGSVTFIPLAVALYQQIGNKKQTAAMLIDMGETKTEIAVVNALEVVRATTLGRGGQDIDTWMADRVESEYAINVAAIDMKELKTQAILRGKETDVVTVVRGKDRQSGRPVSKRLNSSIVVAALEKYLEILVAEVSDILFELPAEILDEVSRSGIFLAGGLSQLPGIDQELASRLNLEVNLLARPKLAGVLGAARLLKNQAGLRHIKVSFDE